MASPLQGTSSAFTSLQGWLAQPFSSDQSVFRWFLFGGLILAIFAAWGLVLRDLKGLE